MDIPKKLKDDIWDYCRLNDIVNIEEFIVKMVRQGYTIEKFGSTPLSNIEVEKIVEVPVEVIKEVIVEKEIVKEIPIEVIVEKEIVKEIPVEKIVTKIEYISDTTTEDELGGMIEKLKENISNLNQEVEISTIDESTFNFENIIAFETHYNSLLKKYTFLTM